MAKILVEFDTMEKTLSVIMDDKKVKDVSEISFFNFGDIASVEMRSVKSSDDDKTVTITKILADEIEEIIINPLTENLSKALFPRKYQ
ncbi:hypothetical protein LCGC14_2590550 [marine sediment metagenome]|uniref:Uncharacterized protein n=1 Tax=marine sediment metagenome TaxID=412755 RepID=A0A0F9CMU4_9ZZZZ